ncbi:MAG: hypothetical protein WC872_04925, partial [Candidatus Absconditabacterales bacterium]
MNNKRLDSIDSIYLGFESLKQAIEEKDDIVLENRIDGFGNTTMQTCQNYFGKDSELYKEAQKIYSEILLGINPKEHQKISGALNLIKS